MKGNRNKRREKSKSRELYMQAGWIRKSKEITERFNLISEEPTETYGEIDIQ